jgi:2,3-bisphosphoglycerate-independent phosphoglycerate mutase
MTLPPRRPVVLCILDGWGERHSAPDNAIGLARKPNWDRLIATCPRGRVNASEGYVGLPHGQMGNSEVGHMNIGAGRVVMQDLPRIDAALADGSLGDNPELAKFVAALKASGGACHLLGLASPGGVHSHQGHIAGLAKLLSERGVKVAIHAFLDGRDTPPQSASLYLDQLAAAIAPLSGVTLATVTGRFYAMDRDKRWDRVETAYNAIVDATGESETDAGDALARAYDRGETDEFVSPIILGGYQGVADGDGVVMANFRADRAREILDALVDPDFSGFPRKRIVKFAAALGMVEYSDNLKRFLGTLFAPETLNRTIGQVVAEAGLTQLRIAETEKYAHVTFFLNGGREEQFPGEERILVPSPRVRTYDLQPEMSAFEVTDRLVEAILSGKFDFVAVNYANGDMVGHTGDVPAATRAVEALDKCIGRLTDAVRQIGGCLLITADHGNVEMMVDPTTGAPHTAHTLNVVPVVLVNGPEAVTSLGDGRLADIAPTVLGLLGLEQPAEMTGQSLLRETAAKPRLAVVRG